MQTVFQHLWKNAFHVPGNSGTLVMKYIVFFLVFFCYAIIFQHVYRFGFHDYFLSKHFNYGEHTTRPNASEEHFTWPDTVFSCFCESDSAFMTVSRSIFSMDSELVKYNTPIRTIAKMIVPIAIDKAECLMCLNC